MVGPEKDDPFVPILSLLAWDSPESPGKAASSKERGEAVDTVFALLFTEPR
jgi:hypothetical protein